MIHCSCGHKVQEFNQTETLSLAEYNEFGDRAVQRATLCESCAKQAHFESRVLCTDSEEDKWLGIDNKKVQQPPLDSSYPDGDGYWN